MSPRQLARKADAIFSADMHLRDDAPVCRVDDFAAAMWRKVAWLADLQREHGCPVVDAGDVFDKWHVSAELEGRALLTLPDDIITVPGNHDLPQHSLRLYQKSSLHVLEAAGKVKVLKEGHKTIQTNGIWITGIPYGVAVEKTEWTGTGDRNIAVVHAYIADTIPPFIKDGWTPAQLLAALPGYDVIVSGHNHTPLVYEHRGRVVVNPGSMLRASADEADAIPCVYLWYADTNTVEPVYYPIEEGVVSRDHLDKVEERDARLEAFVARLDTAETGAELSFTTNMERFLAANAVRPRVREIIWEACDGK